MDFVKDLLYAAKEHWIVLTVVLLAVLVYWHYVVNFTYFKDIGLRGPTPLPLVGNFLNLCCMDALFMSDSLKTKRLMEEYMECT